MNKIKNISTNINKYQQISTNMNKYQGNKYEQISTNMNKTAHCLPVEVALCENYAKSITWQPKSVNRAKPRTEINQT